MPPRGILGQRLEEGFHGAKEFILLYFNSFLLFFACSLSSSGLEAARRAFADDLERSSVFVARRFISVLLIVVAKRKGSGVPVENRMIPLRQYDKKQSLYFKRFSTRLF